jgi:RimJ/RimL family protein N-acetyltransferase
MPFDLQPTLKGRLVELRPLRPDDFDALYAVAADPLIWEQHPVRDRYQLDSFQAFFARSLESGGALAVIDASDGKVIGSSRYRPDDSKDEVEIGWTFLARSHWGGAYNGEMKRLMIEHALRFFERVIFLVAPDNIRSQKAVERIGGVRAGWGQDSAGRPSFVYEIRRLLS